MPQAQPAHKPSCSGAVGKMEGSQEVASPTLASGARERKTGCNPL